MEKKIEEAKKVNLTELFYDLVFVFGVYLLFFFKTIKK